MVSGLDGGAWGDSRTQAAAGRALASIRLGLGRWQVFLKVSAGKAAAAHLARIASRCNEPVQREGPLPAFHAELGQGPRPMPHAPRPQAQASQPRSQPALTPAAPACVVLRAWRCGLASPGGRRPERHACSSSPCTGAQAAAMPRSCCPGAQGGGDLHAAPANECLSPARCCRPCRHSCTSSPQRSKPQPLLWDATPRRCAQQLWGGEAAASPPPHPAPPRTDLGFVCLPLISQTSHRQHPTPKGAPAKQSNTALARRRVPVSPSPPNRRADILRATRQPCRSRPRPGSACWAR